ncbi:metallophosphoesterase [Flavobacterium sp. '19STA2R22 D10 B1']|uniref:metallophosphoesterase n=1 Tax=Flavobacterium aerium TaxID=3037261 RepID=UPI00278C0CD2|nr:metallophosphoesterase [Flavobacterium sp. '19STA2R22 D10 B1']
MKFFWVNALAKRNISILKYIVVIIFFTSCATNHSQFGSKEPVKLDEAALAGKPSHTFFLLGDAGNANEEKAKRTLSLLEKRLEAADSSATLLILGDNIYPEGMPEANDTAKRTLAEEKLNTQLQLSKNFKGKTVFIPGNHDWMNDGINGLRRQEKFVKEALKDKKSFLPRNSCAIDKINISDAVSLIVIDSQWYLENWDNHPTINEDCDIKTREAFFEELEGQINKNQNKVIVIAIHHPLMSNGPHGGQFSLRKQLFPFQSNLPLPILGTVINVLRKTSGISPQDIQNKKYTTLVKRIKTLIQDKNNVIVVSGHEHNLQYIEEDNIKQIISGSGSKTAPARAIEHNDFSYGGNGYAVLDVYGNGASKVSYYGAVNNEEVLLYKQQPTTFRPKPVLKEYSGKFDTTIKASVYTPEMTQKGGFYKFLWGEHYRKYYSLPIIAKTVKLDTLYGGLTPTISGGGHQSRSLRLVDKNGKEYVMRALEKSAVRFLQSVAFKDQYIEKEFKNTFAENFLLDFYTTAHPYTPFVVGDLAESVGIYHTNPVLYYIPKQPTLKLFNEEFGDELYMVEERPMDEFKDLASFGKPNKILSTDDVLANLRKDEKYSIDEKSYIRARMFDMLIGDWDRHSDQWRWSEFKENGGIVYRPIPRDRDQAFTKYDGNLLSLLMNIPALRHMKTFKDDISNVKWFNMEPYPLDLAFITKSDEQVWLDQAKYISEQLTDKEIDKAFLNLPPEMQDETIKEIKHNLKIRKTHLAKYAHKYYKVLQKTVLIVGTDKKDRFVINRMPKGDTQVQVYRMKKTGEELVHDRTYNRSETRELWIYGLDDDDVYEVKGKGRKDIRVRLLGGQNNDVYTIENGKKVNIYDFRTKPNTINNEGGAKTFLSDYYDVNTYDYKKPKYNAISGLPSIGFNPDDGVKLGVLMNYTVNGFNRYPYTQRHNLKANYYFATQGYELAYKGIFTHVVGKWNFVLNGLFTSPNFSVNFFGYGNDTQNFDKDLKRNYNRVKMRMLKVEPALQWNGEQGSSVTVQTSFEAMEVAETADRFIVTPGLMDPIIFHNRNFAGASIKYAYENFNNVSNPTLGMAFSVLGGWKMNLKDTDRQLPYIESSLGFNYPLSSRGNWVLATQLNGKVLLSNDYEFYQAANIGGDLNLRGFRNERFAGKRSFYQSSDLRLNLGKLENGFAPLRYGIFGGYDFGRVWLDGESSDKWHQSVGGGLWLNGANLLTAKLSYFHSSDGGRLSFGLGLGF